MAVALVFELVRSLNHLIGFAGDEVLRLQQPIDRSFRDKVFSMVGEAHRQLPRQRSGNSAARSMTWRRTSAGIRDRWSASASRPLWPRPSSMRWPHDDPCSPEVAARAVSPACSARISLSSSLLAATMNQKSSLVKTLNLSHGRSRGTPFRIWGGLAGNDEVVAPIGGGPTPLSALEATS